MRWNTHPPPHTLLLLKAYKLRGFCILALKHKTSFFFFFFLFRLERKQLFAAGLLISHCSTAVQGCLSSSMSLSDLIAEAGGLGTRSFLSLTQDQSLFHGRLKKNHWDSCPRSTGYVLRFVFLGPGGPCTELFQVDSFLTCSPKCS